MNLEVTIYFISLITICILNLMQEMNQRLYLKHDKAAMQIIAKTCEITCSLSKIIKHAGLTILQITVLEKFNERIH